MGTLEPSSFIRYTGYGIDALDSSNFDDTLSSLFHTKCESLYFIDYDDSDDQLSRTLDLF
jgi:hypothetical protein